MIKTDSEKQIILFDGACNFCNSSVNFLIHHDRKSSFIFIPFQSNEAKSILKNFHLTENDSGSVVLIDGAKAFYKSTAILLAMKKLTLPFSWLYFFILIPKFLRDSVYDWIAKRRYSWFGKKESCEL